MERRFKVYFHVNAVGESDGTPRTLGFARTAVLPYVPKVGAEVDKLTAWLGDLKFLVAKVEQLSSYSDLPPVSVLWRDFEWKNYFLTELMCVQDLENAGWVLEP